MKNKLLGIIIFYLCLVLVPSAMEAQQITGIVKSKSTTISFEDFGKANFQLSGEIKSNFSGSKYTINLENGDKKLQGEISDKFSKFGINLRYNTKKIEGEIKRNPNHTADHWDVQLFDKKLTGTVGHNMANTEDTYNLSYGDKQISGRIYLHMNTLVYDLLFGQKKISGHMSYNISTVKHTYNLMTEDLTEDEFIVFYVIESIKLLNEYIDEIDEFQGNK